MRGILSISGYVPHHRLQQARINEFHGGSAATGTRAVASYDEDTTTMGVAAARTAVAAAPGVVPVTVAFATASPAYQDKTNATAIHAALRFDRWVGAVDLGAAARSTTAAMQAALLGGAPTLLVAADIRTGRPGSADEREGGDGAAAAVIGSDEDGELVAELLGCANVTAEFVDRWREPGGVSRRWEDRFGETQYVPLGLEALQSALKMAELQADDVDILIVTGLHARAVKATARKAGIANVVDDRTSAIGNTGAAHPLLLLADVLEQAEAGQAIALLHLADGADATILRATGSGHSAAPTVAAQVDAGDDALPYAKFLSWRGHLDVEPPNRPSPARASSSAAARGTDWKYGFVGSRDKETGALHLPPARASFEGGAIDQMEPAPMADVLGTVTTFTIDRLAWSPSPPTVFAVVDFDGGGRFACELTDVNADGIRNHVWKARPVRPGMEA
ncbi:MAG: OB-fold domain-containing protein [Nitriliruptorales bacterium]|nr:OB-fold domain-containing protein [Nitriliruptorales bacterium]